MTNLASIQPYPCSCANAKALAGLHDQIHCMWRVIYHAGEVWIREGKFMGGGGKAQTWRHQGFKTVGDLRELLQIIKWTTVGEGLWNCWFFGSWIRGGSSYCVEFDVKNGIFRVGMWGPLLWKFRDGWILRDHSSSQVPRFYWSKGRAHRRS